jgi:hypothetical protein
MPTMPPVLPCAMRPVFAVTGTDDCPPALPTERSMGGVAFGLITLDCLHLFLCYNFLYGH